MKGSGSLLIFFISKWFLVLKVIDFMKFDGGDFNVKYDYFLNFKRLGVICSDKRGIRKVFIYLRTYLIIIFERFFVGYL